MLWEILCAALFLLFLFSPSTFAQPKDSCTTLMDIKFPGVKITKAAHVEPGSTEPIPWNQSRSAPLPAYCRVEGVVHRRIGVGGEEFGITFALAMPDKWNGDFLMQGGGGSNGIRERALQEKAPR
jgi:feruloyl esterase